jgi:hypothetical protein
MYSKWSESSVPATLRPRCQIVSRYNQTTRLPVARIVMCTFGNVVCITAASCLAYLPESAKWGRLVALWFTNFQSIGFALGLVMISSNIGGYTKKQFTSGVVFVAYCAGNIAGPQCKVRERKSADPQSSTRTRHPDTIQQPPPWLSATPSRL